MAKLIALIVALSVMPVHAVPFSYLSPVIESATEIKLRASYSTGATKPDYMLAKWRTPSISGGVIFNCSETRIDEWVALLDGQDMTLWVAIYATTPNGKRWSWPATTWAGTPGIPPAGVNAWCLP